MARRNDRTSNNDPGDCADSCTFCVRQSSGAGLCSGNSAATPPTDTARQRARFILVRVGSHLRLPPTPPQHRGLRARVRWLRSERRTVWPTIPGNTEAGMRRTSSAVVAAVFVTTLTIADVGTQSTSPAFDAASVKPNKSGDPRTSVALQAGGRFTATNVPLRGLIGRAYGAPGTLVRAFSGLSDSQLVGGPDWINAERFDIVATAGPSHELGREPRSNVLPRITRPPQR